MQRWILISGAALALAACGERASEEPAPAPPEAASNKPKPQSIIRPDIEEAQEIPLEPLKLRIGFPEGGSNLGDRALEKLKALVASEQVQAGGAIVLRGHSDSSGSDVANIRASQGRAEAVRDYLAVQGIVEDRFRIIAFGEQNPVEPNALPDGAPNEDGRAANRRVDITVLVPDTKAQSKGATSEEQPQPDVD